MLKNIRGLKYPDIYITRFFFKEILHKSPGKVLELGCGNGNNLMLFVEYNWNVTGIDNNNKAINNANYNFGLLKKKNSKLNKYRFLKKDMNQFI